MKIWSKGVLEDKLKKDVLEFLSGEDIILDEKLVKWDIIGTIAHVVALKKSGVLNKEELKKILSKLLEYYQNGIQLKLELEDVHSNLEENLTGSLSEIGEKIHTGRSRNEQIILDLNLYMKKETIEILNLVLSLAKTLVELGEKYNTTIIPGYTHHQQAMPYTFSSFLLAHFYSLVDDMKLLRFVYDFVDRNPLGSGAGYGLPLDIDKKLTTKLLGFKSSYGNSLHAINSRGKNEALFVESLVHLMLDLNRLSQDLIIFSMKELDFIELPDEYCTGSSIMPHKKNPDVLEIIKGKTSKVLANLLQIFTVMKNNPSGYHRDLQETKHSLMHSIETTKLSLKMMNGIIKNLKVNEKKIKDKLSNEIFSVYYAYSLIKKGVPYKKAYRIVAEKIKKGEKIPMFKVKPDLGNYKEILKEVECSISRMKKEFHSKIESLINLAKTISKN